MPNKDYASMMPASPRPDEAMAGGGSPTGAMQEVDMMREQIMMQLEQMGVFNAISSDQEMQEILALVEDLVQAMLSGDQEAMAQNPLMQILGAQQAAPGPEAGMAGGGMMPGPEGM